MSTNPIRPNKAVNTRRSQRLLLRIPVVVADQRADGKNFVEQASTEVVNAHGAPILLGEPIAKEQLLRMKHVKSGDEEPCKVVAIGQKGRRKNGDRCGVSEALAQVLADRLSS